MVNIRYSMVNMLNEYMVNAVGSFSCEWGKLH